MDMVLFFIPRWKEVMIYVCKIPLTHANGFTFKLWNDLVLGQLVYSTE